MKVEIVRRLDSSHAEAVLEATGETFDAIAARGVQP